MKFNIDELHIYYIKGRFKGNLGIDSYLGCWIEDGDSFLFFSKEEDELVRNVLKADGSLVLKDHVEVDYFDWIGGRFSSFEIGGIKLIPIWDWDKDTTIGEREILIDPCVVFGAGNHKTTYNCLLAIHFLFSSGFSINRVVDIGCGTGILSLFCAKKGAEEVFAIDLNPLAVKTTRKNVVLNGLEDKILSIWGRGEDFLYLKGDLLVANVHYDVLSSVLDRINCSGFKWLILSGIFPSQVTDIISLLKSKKFKLLNILGEHSGWPTIVGGRSYGADK